jgi:hypothetical protein
MVSNNPVDDWDYKGLRDPGHNIIDDLVPDIIFDIIDVTVGIINDVIDTAVDAVVSGTYSGSLNFFGIDVVNKNGCWWFGTHFLTDIWGGSIGNGIGTPISPITTTVGVSNHLGISTSGGTDIGGALGFGLGITQFIPSPGVNLLNFSLSIKWVLLSTGDDNNGCPCRCQSPPTPSIFYDGLNI